MATRIQIRRDTSANWTANDPLLSAGELALSTDLGKIKVGDGSTSWSSLTYISLTPTEIQTAIDNAVSGLVDSAPGVLDTLNEIAAAINDDPNFFTTVATNLSNHETDTTNIHGIADTSLLATTSYVDTAESDAVSTANAYSDSLASNYDPAGSASTAQSNAESYADSLASNYDPAGSASAVASDLTDHENATTNVHGIADTSLLATTSYVDTAESDAVSTANSYADSLASNYDAAGSASAVASDLTDHENATTNVHGIVDTSALATKTYADNAGVTSLTGTASEIDVSASSGAVTLSLPATINADTTGNAATASALETARSISLGGDVSGSASFDGGSNITITAAVEDDSHDHTISNVDGLQSALDDKAPLASPALTGTPTAPTASASANTTQIATTAFVQTAVSNLIDGAPGALDTLNELAASLGDDADFAGTVTNSLAGKQPLDSDLTAIAGLSASATGYAKKTGDGTWSVGDVALGTDTTGNYVASISGTTNEIEVTGSGSESAAVTLSLPSTINVNTTGNAGTATKLATERAIALTGDVTGTANFDGSASAGIAATLANTAVSPAPYGSASAVGTFTVDSKGRLTAAADTPIVVAQSAVTNLTTDLGLKANLASPTFTGTPAAPTAAVDTNTTQVATTAFVVGQGYLKSTSASSTYAPLASPDLSGTPTAPTASAGTDTTQVATTAFVQNAVKTVTTNAQTASYTLAVSDAGKVVEMNVASANDLTVPLNSSVAIPVGSSIDIIQYGAGQTTIVAAGGVTIRSKEGNLKLTDQYSGATLYKRDTDEWVVIGDLTS